MSLDLTSDGIVTGHSAPPAHADASAIAAARGAPRPHLKIRPRSGWAALDLRELWQFRDLLLAMAGRDIKLRYKQTVLGIGWVLLQPLLAAGIFSFVFGTVAGFKAGEATPYFVFSYAGLLGWNLFNGFVSRCVVCLVVYAGLISKIYFPRLVLPLSIIPTSLVDFAVALVMLAVLMATYHIVPDIRILTFPIWVALLVLLSVGLGLWTSALNVRYRDVQYILPVFLQMLLYASPLAYPVSKIPANLLTLYHLNPLVSLITGLRWSLLPGSETPHWGFVIYSFAFTLVLLIAGAFTFKRMERLFADVI